LKDYSSASDRPIGQDETVTIKEKLSLAEILQADNVADLLDEDDLTTISQQVKEDYNTDLRSCAFRLKHLKDITELAMIIAKQKSYPWTGASNIVYPLIANACVEFGASCYPEMIKDENVVKAKVIGKDDGKQMIDADGVPMIDPQSGQPIMQNVGEKQKRGDRVSTLMNYQLIEEQTWWESDTDKLVHALPTLGDIFRKVYYDPIREMPISELVFPDKLIINNGARDIDSATVTQIIELYPQEVMERIRSGIFKNFDFQFDDDSSDGATTAQSINSDLEITQSEGINSKLHVFLEQHTWYDMDKDGFPEPYIITVHQNDMKVVRIIPRFKQAEVKYNSKKEVKYIKAQKYFVHYKFIPSPDGSFYSLGFGHLLYNLNKGINSSVNQLIDAGHLNITGGGFIAKGIKMKGGRVALSPGEWRIVDVGGDDLQRGIVPLPTPQPSQVLFTLIGALIDAGKQLGAFSDVLSGQTAGNVQATTMISMIEQGLKKFKSIYKRLYKAEKDEFKLLYDINSEYLSPEKYAEILDEPVTEVDVKADFNKRGYDICPVADIDAVTNFQRMAMAQFYMGFIQDPYVNPLEIRKRIFEAVNAEDINKIIVAPQPQPDPLLQIEQMKNETKNRELDIKSQEVMANIERLRLELQKMEAEIANIHADSMAKEANAINTLKGASLKEQTESVKVLDNQIDAQIKQIEVEGRKKDAELKHITEVMKLQSNEKLAQMKLDLEREKQGRVQPQIQE
jgi:chaperonin GroES